MTDAGRTTKLGDDLTVSSIGFGAGALAAYGDATYVRQCLDESLDRLQTDVVDLGNPGPSKGVI